MTRSYVTFIAALTIGPAVFAGNVYVGVGLPGVFVGYSQPVSNALVLRVDAATLGHHRTRHIQSGISYEAKLKADRLGMFADWYVQNGFRLTGGLTLNNARADMTGRSSASRIDIGGRTYAAGPDDRIDVVVRFPRVMPYAGVGWGSRPAAGKGWSMAVDLGIVVGKPRVDGRVSASHVWTAG